MGSEESSKSFCAPLYPGATLGITAPGGAFDPESFQRGIDVLSEMGWRVWIPEGLLEKEGYLAGSDTHRADLLHQCFAEAAVDGILCARGGFGSMRLLPLLDFDLIRKNPKPFIGFSDATALLNAFFERSNCITFHGPMVTTLADAPPKTRDAMAAALSCPRHLEIFSVGAPVIHPGRAEGKLMGGNLATLCHLTGTPFMPDFKGRILFFEDCGEAPYRIDRMLTQMALAGAFEGISGIALGAFTDCQDEAAVHDIFQRRFESMGIPILGGFEVGHGAENLTVPVGAPAILDADRASLEFHLD